MLTTPIDAHLPLVIAIVLVCSWLVRATPWTAAVQCAVPLLIAAMMGIAHEPTRLLAYGVIGALSIGIAAIALPRPNLPDVLPRDVLLAIAAIALLRWIPLHDVHLVKELLVLAGSAALLLAIPPNHRTPASLIGVLAVAVVTPIAPGKMTLFPFAVAVLVLVTRRVPPLAVAAALLLCAWFARYSLATIYIAAALVFLAPLFDRVRPLAYGAALVVLALWPWSGIIARALPVVRSYEPASGEVQAIAQALAPGEARDIAVPPHVWHLVVTASAARAERLRPGRLLGTIEAIDGRGWRTTRPIRIGDVADFGFLRREQFFGSRNPLPRVSPGEIRDYGADAWVWAGGRMALACRGDIVSLRVIAAPDLPRQAHLQIDSVEFPVP